MGMVLEILMVQRDLCGIQQEHLREYAAMRGLIAPEVILPDLMQLTCSDIGGRYDFHNNAGICLCDDMVPSSHWNKRLLDRSSHRAFEKYMQEELDVTCIQSITQGLKSDRFYFLALSF